MLLIGFVEIIQSSAHLPCQVWFNNKGWTASVSYMNAMNNLILRSLLPQDKDPRNYGIVTVNHPLNLTKAQLNEETL